MQPQRLVPASASPDNAAAASQGRAVMALSVVSHCGGAALGILGGGETALHSRHGSNCSAFLRVDDGSEWRFKNERSRAMAWTDLHEITRGGGF